MVGSMSRILPASDLERSARGTARSEAASARVCRCGGAADRSRGSSAGGVTSS
jgi:hypothetical protein